MLGLLLIHGVFDLMGFMKILIIFAFSISSVFAHQDLSHTWLGDKAAYKSVKKMEMGHFVKSNRKALDLVTVDKTFLEEKLAQYSGAADVEINGKVTRIKERRSSEGRALARSFLKNEYQKLGFSVQEHSYGTFRKGANFVAEKKGQIDRVLILSSHIDSVRNAGANDDGTGTIAALAIAKALAGENLKYTLRIVGFDQEEIGLVGSKAYVKTLSKDQIIGDIQMEMMGTNSRQDGVFHIIDCDKKTSTFLTHAIAQAITDQALPISINKACTTRSDHSSFWNEGMPAVVLSENFFGGDSDPCYHRSCDVLDDRIDFEYMKNIIQAVANASKTILVQ